MNPCFGRTAYMGYDLPLPENSKSTRLCRTLVFSKMVLTDLASSDHFVAVVSAHSENRVGSSSLSTANQVPGEPAPLCHTFVGTVPLH